MDPRRTAGWTSAPSAGKRTPRPSPGHAAQRGGRVVPPAPAEDEEWTIGVSDVPPWELAGMTDRSPALPPVQPAPWEAARQAAAPWEQPPQESPWEQPATGERAPWEQPAQEAAQRMHDEPGDAAPWDRPAPFTFDDAAETNDPYDAFAPLADEFAQPAPATRSAVVAPARSARAVARTAQHSMTTVQQPRPDSDSVFGDSFAAVIQRERVVAALAVEDAPAEAEAARGPDTEAPDWPTPETDTAQSADTGGSADTAAAAESPANPLEWPPVPTDFPVKKQSRARRQPPADPLEWPPIPDDLFPTPDTPAQAGQPAQPDQGLPTAPAGSLWATPAPATSAPAPTAPAPSAPATATTEPRAASAEAGGAQVDQAQPAAASPAAAEAAEPEPWALRSISVEERSAARQAVPTEPPSKPAEIDEDDAGAVFARYAAGVAAPARAPAMPAMPAAAEAPTRHVPSTDGGDDLWFLANEPEPVVGDGTAAESEPSSMQTAVATVLVAAIVIGLVIVFLLLFTSIFR